LAGPPEELRNPTGYAPEAFNSLPVWEAKYGFSGFTSSKKKKEKRNRKLGTFKSKAKIQTRPQRAVTSGGTSKSDCGTGKGIHTILSSSLTQVKYDRDITPHPHLFHGTNSHEAATEDTEKGINKERESERFSHQCSRGSQ